MLGRQMSAGMSRRGCRFVVGAAGRVRYAWLRVIEVVKRARVWRVWGGKNGACMKKYESPIKYEVSRIHAAALYCSDGRMGEHFDDFLQNGLNLPRYDRVSLPGGPACLAGHPEVHVEEQGVVDELQFLVEVHKLKRVVLIAHEGCAMYITRLALKDRRLELVMRADLVRAAAFVHRVTGLGAIEAYYARMTDGKVVFEEVEV